MKAKPNSLNHLYRVVLILFTIGFAPVNHADTLDSILDILVTTGFVDPAVRDARPLISCMINSPPEQCADAVMSSQGYMPEDPAIQSVVKVIKAAYQNQWVTVLEITGTDVLFQVVCKTSLSASGPFKNFICGSVFPKAVAIGKPVVKQTLIAIGSGDFDEWVKLISMAGPQLGCELMPSSVPGKDAICGPLGEVLAFAAKAISDAANAVWGGINNVGDWLSGQDKHMDREHYYALYWQPWYHYGTKLGVAHNWQGWNNLLAYIRNPCVKYFDSHTMSEENAKELCDYQRSRFSKEVKAFVDAMKIAPDAFYDLAIKDMPPIAAIEDYGQQNDNLKRQFVNNLCETHMIKTFPFPEPNPAKCQSIKAKADQVSGVIKDMLNDMYNQCVTDQNTQMPSPTVWAHVCTPLGNRFVSELSQERTKLDNNIRDLVVTGCLPPTGWSPANGIDLTCINYTAYNQCLDVFDVVKAENYCHLNKTKADNKLARTIRNELGLKRCGLKGETTVVCTRPWKKDRCEVLRKAAIQNLPQTSDLQCEYMFDSSYTSGIDKTRTIVEALNTISNNQPGSDQETNSAFVYQAKDKIKKLSLKDRIRLKPANNCSTTWDPLSIICKDSSVLFELNKNYPELKIPPVCLADPNRDGSSVPCYAGMITLPENITKTLIDPKVIDRSSKKDISAFLPKSDNKKGSKNNTGGFVSGGVFAKGKENAKLPDITTRDTVNISGASIQWGSTHTISNNLSNCQINVNYYVKNSGNENSSAFAIQWIDAKTNAVLKAHRIYGLKANTEYHKNDKFTIKPGVNQFNLVLDSSSEVAERNEKNNNKTFSVRYTGQCGVLKTSPMKVMPTNQSNMNKNFKSSSPQNSGSKNLQKIPSR